MAAASEKKAKDIRTGQETGKEILRKLGWDKLSTTEVVNMLLVMVVDQRASIAALVERVGSIQ